ncbi:hypothetical protein CGMCC3_g7923 [Colletotrichum fructicola]|nr:uncharacterized protein CGMCC3_g7923 [Colletotrichum fructicola]KAE9576117.1 hypothetical protein CGMCC3_g7923 [Colletotrichum fructicola]
MGRRPIATRNPCTCSASAVHLGLSSSVVIADDSVMAEKRRREHSRSVRVLAVSRP